MYLVATVSTGIQPKSINFTSEMLDSENFCIFFDYQNIRKESVEKQKATVKED